MLVTEEQAREKWCPFVRFDDEGCNRHYVQAHHIPETDEQVARHSDNNPVYARCVASSCMAWRWSDQRKEVIEAGGYDQQTPEKLVRMGWCGLTGEDG
jgi:hypothetical protein